MRSVTSTTTRSTTSMYCTVHQVHHSPPSLQGPVYPTCLIPGEPTTHSPQVSPHSGILTPGGLAEVRVRALVHGQAKLERERFQLAIVTNVREGEEVKAVFEDKNRVGREECVLSCEVERVRRTSTLENGTVEQANKQARVLSRKLSEMEDRMGQLRILLVAQCGLLLLAIAYFCISRGLNRSS